MGRLTNEDKTFIRNNATMSNKDLAEILHHDRHTIGHYKQQLGLAFSQTHDFSSYNEYIKQNYYTKSSRQLAQEIGCSVAYIQKVWSENHLTGKTTYQYYCNYNFFKNINTAEQAYILGLLASDGNLYKRDGHEGQIQFTLKNQDKEILQKILTVLKSNHPIKHNNKNQTVTITLVSEVIYNDLLAIGLQPQKTWHLQLETILNNIPKSLWKDFILGYFDGDGTVSGKDKPSTFQVSFAIPMNISQIMQQAIYTITHENFIITEDTRSDKYKFPFGILAAKNSTQKYLLLKTFYYDNPFLCLTRKKEKALQFINMVEANITNRSENITAVTKWGELLENLKWQSAAEP